MSDQKRQAYRRLKALLEESNSAPYDWVDTGKVTEWHHSVQSALRRLYGNSSDQLKAFNNVSFTPIMFTTDSPNSVFHDAFNSGMKHSRAIMRSAIQEFEDYEQASLKRPKRSVKSKSPPLKVFVVHGHDIEMRETVARFLEKLGFEAIVLHEQANAGATIIEKFERHSGVAYAVVLLSPDDMGAAKAHKRKLQPRARQNVVLELGYFLGRLGRSHVCPLVRGPLEIPSDFHGVVYVPFDGEQWKIHLVKELKHLGFAFDANKAF